MKNTTLNLLLIFVFLVIQQSTYSQTRIELLSIKLDSLAQTQPGLSQTVELSVSKASLQEVIRTIAVANKLNAVVDPGVQTNISYNFTNVPAKDVFTFLCREYDLDLVFTGRIISVIKYIPRKQYIKKGLILGISDDNLLTADLRNDSLQAVIRELTDLTGANIVPAPELQNRIVNMYIKKQGLKDFLNNMALANKMAVTEYEGVYYLKDELAIQAAIPVNTGFKKIKSSATGSNFNAVVKSKDDISVTGNDVPLSDVIDEVSRKLDLNYFKSTEIDGTTNVNLKHISFDSFLENILKETKYSYSLIDGLYIIGSRALDGVRIIRFYNFKNRSVTGILELLPETIKKDLILKEYHEQNSIIISGAMPLVNSFEELLARIDQVVPLVMIEVMIINNETGYSISTGLQAGIGDKPVQTGGTLLSGVDFTLSGNSITNLLNRFNGFGNANLGKVNPNFYLTIKALEEQGFIKVKSTPLLTTLNGHEAKMKLGNTQYYIEETSDYIINQSTQQRTLKQYKAVNADFSLTITPIVSGDEQITLDIKVEQSDFTDRIEKGAPPGQVSRSFSSLIRVRNEEMILLGGLESTTDKETGSGIPLLSRIPVIKWLFSNKTKEKKASKLNIFIKPTVIY